VGSFVYFTGSEIDLLIDIFKFDPNFLQNEDKYRQIKAEILGEDESSEEGSDESDEDESEEEAVPDKEGIEDQTGTNVVNLRRTIYLTIMNSVSNQILIVWHILIHISFSSTLKKQYTNF